MQTLEVSPLVGVDTPAGVAGGLRDDAAFGRDVPRPPQSAMAREALRAMAAVAGDDGGAGLLELVEELLDGLADVVLVGDLDDLDVRASVARVARLQDRLEAEKLRRLVEADERGAYTGSGRSPADAVARQLGCTYAEARQLLETARALQRMPKTRAALARGDISAANAREAARQLLEDERLARLAEERRRAEQEAEDARRRQGDAEDEADGEGGCGGLFGDDDGGDDGDDGGGDGLAGDGERHDGAPSAEEQAAEAAADIDDATAGAGRDRDRNRLRDELRDRQARNRPDLAQERARRALERRNLWWGPDRRPGNDGLGLVEAAASPELLALLGVAVDAQARNKAAGDERSLGQRRHDVLVEILRRHLDGGWAPVTGGVRPHALLVTSPEALHGHPDAPPPVLDGVGPVSIETARQVCCDSDVTDVVVRNRGARGRVDERGAQRSEHRSEERARSEARRSAGGADQHHEVLDVGRRRRLFTDAQRAAVFATYTGCIGCAAPLWRTQIHHVHWWDRNGPTDLGNGGPACQGCHTNIHHFGWVVWRDPATGRFGAGPPERAPAGAPVFDGQRPT